jgi:hypothetical protein
MSLTRPLTGALVALAAVVVVGAPPAGSDKKPPRIVSAAMRDSDADSRADRLRLVYSERIRHSLDRDGRYPFTVAGYRIRSVGAASGRALVLALVEKATPDYAAKPWIRYARALSRPVTDRARNQALAQAFRLVRAHGRAPGAQVPTPATPPAPAPPTPPVGPPTSSDRDGDGSPNEKDCAPDDPAVRPGTRDVPDLSFLDSNCDGIDGTEADAVFASPLGNDTNVGTKAAPKREIAAAVAAAFGSGKYVLAAAGSYQRVDAASNVGIYGGYDAASWSRRTSLVTAIVGSPEGIRASNATGVVLQLLRVTGATQAVNVPGGTSFYGIRAVAGSSIALQRVSVAARSGTAGAEGARGESGVSGQPGGKGGDGECDGDEPGAGGGGGTGAAGRNGGAGGRGGYDAGGSAGYGLSGGTGLVGIPGGAGRPAGDPGADGFDGSPGAGGAEGVNAPGGASSITSAKAVWEGEGGGNGSGGSPGNAGGGGGGGGGQICAIFCDQGSGNGGGGGGGAGGGGGGGAGGRAGGGSFGLYLYDSSATVSDSSSIVAAQGGAGGRGGEGGLQGPGGSGGLGGTYCKGEIGEGGDGGPGGHGGHGGGGGGGAGGPSIGIVRAGASKVAVTGSTVTNGVAGAGGPGGAGGTGSGGPGDKGIAQRIYPS